MASPWENTKRNFMSNFGGLADALDFDLTNDEFNNVPIPQIANPIDIAAVEASNRAANGGYGRGVSPGMGGNPNRPMLAGKPSLAAANPNMAGGFGGYDDGSAYNPVVGGRQVPIGIPSGPAASSPSFPSFARGQITAAPQAELDQYAVAGGAPVPANAKSAKVLKKATAPAKTKKQKAKRGAARAAVTKAENKAVVNAAAGRKQPGVHEALMGLNAGAFGAGGPRGAYGYNNDEILSMF